jgi:hypothetical protein
MVWEIPEIRATIHGGAVQGLENSSDIPQPLVPDAPLSGADGAPLALLTFPAVSSLTRVCAPLHPHGLGNRNNLRPRRPSMILLPARPGVCAAPRENKRFDSFTATQPKANGPCQPDRVRNRQDLPCTNSSDRVE